MNPVRTAVLALRRLGLLPHLTFDAPLRLNGRLTRVPLVRGMGMLNVLEFEPFMDELIARAVPLFPGVFLDVGVNIAQTLIKAKNLHPDIDYIGFEPNAVCIRYAERVVRKNNYRNVRFVPAGLTDRDGEGVLTLWLGGADDPTGTLMNDFRPPTAGQRTITVPLTRWVTAEARYGIGPLGFIKIDVEGSELFVLRELRERMRTDRPIVAVEVLPSQVPPIADRLERQQAIEALTQELDMVIYRVHKSAPVRIERITGFGVHANIGLIDHLLVPSEREQDVLSAFAP